MEQRDNAVRQGYVTRHGGAGISLGSWRCPSGNSVDVFLTQDASGRYHTWHYWDEPPPLLPADRTYYFTVIRPAITRAVQDLTGLSGPVLVATIE